MQGMMDGYYRPQYYQYTSRALPKPRNVIIVYEQPKVMVVRRYTRAFVPHVSPDEYRNRYGSSLLDSSTLLQWCRRLNIPDSLIAPPRMHWPHNRF